MKTEIVRALRGQYWIDTHWGNGALEVETNIRNWGLGFNVRWYPPESTGGRLPVVVATHVGPFAAALYMGKS